MKRTPIKRSTKPKCPGCGRVLTRSDHTCLGRTPVRKNRPGPARRVSVVRDKGYREWLTVQRCVACIAQPRGFKERAFVDPAHTGKTNGMRSKSGDDSCIPLCRTHHDEMDGRLLISVTTKEQFAAKYGLDLAAIAAEYYARYKQEQSK